MRRIISKDSGFARGAGKMRQGFCLSAGHSPLRVLLRASAQKPAGLRRAAVFCLLLLTVPAAAQSGAIRGAGLGWSFASQNSALSAGGGEPGCSAIHGAACGAGSGWSFASQNSALSAGGGEPGYRAIRGAGSGEFFVGVSAETALYSIDAVAFGGGLTAGYGFGAGAVGLGLRYLVDTGGLTTYAPHLFARLYLPQTAPRSGSGPFLQCTLGPSFHTWNPRIPPGRLAGAVSADLSAGWRFLLGERWYVEPALRAGYPFIIGAGIAAGYRI